jgi:5-methylcytosine-specific restriction enzyme subunit McrC
MAGEIPIRNVYYLLCYAWNRLAEGDLIDVSAVDTTELADLFSTVLVSGTNHLLRRGLDQGYQTFDGELRSIRGRIDLIATARRTLNVHGKAYCHFDDLNLNTLPNQILKATIRHLSGVPNLDSTLRHKLLFLYRSLHDIDDVALSKFVFRKVQLQSNNRFYRFLLNVCELVQACWLVDEKTGQYKFRDFIRDETRMPRLFEDFVYNFFRLEEQGWDVRKERIYWAATSEVDPALRYLPMMATDISIRDGRRTLIIDAKYYKETLQRYYDSQTIHSANLYQLFAYLKNLEARGGNDAQAEGMLIYPVIDKELRLSYDMHGHRIRISTIDLGKDWKDIRGELLSLVA